MSTEPTQDQQTQLAKMLLSNITRQGTLDNAIVDHDTRATILAFVPLEVWTKLTHEEPTADGRVRVYARHHWLASAHKAAVERREGQLRSARNIAKWRLITALVDQKGLTKDRAQLLVEGAIECEGSREGVKAVWTAYQRAIEIRENEIQAEFELRLEEIGTEKRKREEGGE